MWILVDLIRLITSALPALYSEMEKVKIEKRRMERISWETDHDIDNPRAKEEAPCRQPHYHAYYQHT